jgi:tRNA (guanine-N7-)-methyltransferase
MPIVGYSSIPVGCKNPQRAVFLFFCESGTMSKRNKLEKFAEVLSFPNTFENFDHSEPSLLGKNGKPVDLKGKWAADYFRNDHPITLELACGRGEYTLALARTCPERNFIGVDIKGARIWKGARIALEEGLTNAAFLRTRIEQLNYFFEAGEVHEIWITFPDPFPRKSKANRRLTAPNFLEVYRRVLAKDGLVHLKTDADSLYEFSLDTLRNDPRVHILYQDDDIYAKPLAYPELNHKTYYEHMHLEDGRTIKYLRFRIHGNEEEE